jgi:hypothetical protein
MELRRIFGECSVAVVEITATMDVTALGQAGDRAARQPIEMMIALLLPVGSGELRLPSADPQAQLLLDYDYLADACDRQGLRAGVRLALKLAEHDSFKTIIGPRIDPRDTDLVSDAALERV